MDDEIALQALHTACQQVLPSLASDRIRTDDHIAEEIRETCRDLERRLTELGVPFTSCFD